MSDIHKLATFLEQMPELDTSQIVAALSQLRQLEKSRFNDIDPNNYSHSNTFTEQSAFVSREMFRGLDAFNAVARLLSTPRDLKMFARHLHAAWTALHGEVNLDELFCIHALRQSNRRLAIPLVAPDDAVTQDGTRTSGGRSISPWDLVSRNLLALRSSMAQTTNVVDREQQLLSTLIEDPWDPEGSIIRWLFRVGEKINLIDWPQGVRWRGHPDYWARSLAESAVESPTDQQLLRGIEVMNSRPTAGTVELSDNAFIRHISGPGSNYADHVRFSRQLTATGFDRFLAYVCTQAASQPRHLPENEHGVPLLLVAAKAIVEVHAGHDNNRLKCVLDCLSLLIPLDIDRAWDVEVCLIKYGSRGADRADGPEIVTKVVEHTQRVFTGAFDSPDGPARLVEALRPGDRTTLDRLVRRRWTVLNSTPPKVDAAWQQHGSLFVAAAQLSPDIVGPNLVEMLTIQTNPDYDPMTFRFEADIAQFLFRPQFRELMLFFRDRVDEPKEPLAAKKTCLCPRVCLRLAQQKSMIPRRMPNRHSGRRVPLTPHATSFVLHPCNLLHVVIRYDKLHSHESTALVRSCKHSRTQ